MPLWETCVVLGIWLTVRRWRRLRRSGRGAPSSPPSRPLSQRIEQRRSWLAESDPERVAHDSPCGSCGVQTPVPMTRTRLERRPWRLVWRCPVCNQQGRFACPPELVDVFAKWDRAGGTSLSMREVADMVRVDLDALNRAIEEELG
jgi:hypothetical protein